MPEETERIPPDLKLLGEIIVALNISCRNAGIYPKDHPAVDISLRRAFELFQKMFESRQGFTIAVGKDTLLIDNYSLDRRNPSYSQFAGLLKKLNIAFVTFLRRFTKEELYVFQHFVSKQLQGLSHDDLHEVLNSQSLAHIQIGFADYSNFFPEEGKTSPEIVQEDIWEIYIMGLISGTLKKEDLDEIEKIPADIFSEIINKMHKNYFDKTATKTFLNAYIQKLFQQSVKPCLPYLRTTIRGTIARTLCITRNLVY